MPPPPARRRGWPRRAPGSGPPRPPRLPAREAALAAVGEPQAGVAAERADAGVVDLLHPHGQELAPGDLLEIEVAAVAHRVAVAGECGMHLLAHLVAARAGAGPDGRGHPSGAPQLPQRPGTPRDHA